jgi:uncharacterized protein (TIRG00374 family)
LVQPQHLFAALRIAVGLGLLLYLSLSGAIAWSALAGLAKSRAVSLSALGLLLTMVGLTSWRLCLLLKARGLHLTLGSSVRLTLIGAYFNAFLPGATGGDLARVYYATKSNRGHRTEITTVILFDRLFGVFALMALPLLIAALVPELLRSMHTLRILLWCAAAGCIATLLGLVICLAGGVTMERIVLPLFERLPLGRYIKRIYVTVHAYRENLGTLAGVIAISITVHALLVIVMLFLVHVTSSRAIEWSMAILIPFGLLANSLPITPGGLGVGEMRSANCLSRPD